MTDCEDGGPLRRAMGLLLAFCLFPLTTSAAEFHRWVDEYGNVHYTDAPPPGSVRSGKPRPGANSDGETDSSPAESARAAAEARAARAKRDRMLLQSYATVEEIERTRDRRLDGVEGEIGLARHRVRRAEQQIEKYDALLADLPEDSEHRPEMQSQRGEVQTRLERRERDLRTLQRKKSRMQERFAEDIERFRELTGQAENDSR